MKAFILFATISLLLTHNTQAQSFLNLCAAAMKITVGMPITILIK